MSHPRPACSTWEEGREGSSWRFLPLPWHSSRSHAPASCMAQGNRQPCPGCGVGKPHPVGQGSLNAAGTRAVAQRGRKAFRRPSSPTAGVGCLPLHQAGMAHPSRDPTGQAGCHRPEDEDGQETGRAPRPGHIGGWGRAARWHRSPPRLLRGSRSWLGDGFLAARGIVCVISSRFINCSDAASTARFLARTASSGPTSPRTQRSKTTGISASPAPFPHPSRAPQIHPIAKPGQAFDRAPRGTAEPKLLGSR